MALVFPNSSRSYARPKRCVSFWGYDASIEIAREVDIDALQRMSPNATLDEASLLQAFDANRASIERAASTAYARRRQTYVRLSPSDF